MFKLSVVVVLGAIAAALALPVPENVPESLPDETSERELVLRQGGILASLLGQIGTSLVPVFGAVLGPILTNLASGISEAFNNGLNPAATPTKGESEVSEVEPASIIVRIPPDTPLYNFLVAHPSLDKEGLLAVGPHNAQVFGSKFVATFQPETKSQDDDSIAVDTEDVNQEDEEVKITRNPNVKRYPQRVKTQTEYA